jgi:hypothetical protein
MFLQNTSPHVQTSPQQLRKKGKKSSTWSSIPRIRRSDQSAIEQALEQIRLAQAIQSRKRKREKQHLRSNMAKIKSAEHAEGSKKKREKEQSKSKRNQEIENQKTKVRNLQFVSKYNRINCSMSLFFSRFPFPSLFDSFHEPGGPRKR